MTTTITPVNAQKVWVFSANGDGTLSPTTFGGGGSAAFSAITSGTNTTAAMVVGTGASLATSGSGTITASALPFSGLSSATNTTAAMVIGTGGSLTVSGSGTNNATTLGGATFASPGAIGGTTPAAGTFTPGVTLGIAGTTSGVLTLAGVTSGTATLTAPSVAGTTTNAIVASNNLSAPALVSTVTTGTAPLQVTSTTVVANLNASSLGGATFASPGAIGGTSASSGAFTSLSSTGILSNSQAGALSASAVSITGAPVTGGSGTTTFPLIYLNTTGATAVTTFSANGTFLGINAPSGYTGNFFDSYVNGVVVATITSGGAFTTVGSQAAGTAAQIGINGRSGFRSAANGRASINSNGNGSGGLTRITFGTEATANPAFSFDGTTQAITTCDGAGVAANGIMNSALYKSGGTSGVSAGSFATITAITTVGGIVTQLTGTSDERLKDSTSFNGGLSVIEGITPVRYRWNKVGQDFTGISGDKDFVGFLAQNVQRVLPESVTNTEGLEKYLSFDDRPVVAALVNAVKELAQRVVTLESR